LLTTRVKGEKMKAKRKLAGASSAILFTLPALAPLMVFWIYPIIRTVLISFTDWDYMTPTYNAVGLANYVGLLKSKEFMRALANTLSLCFFSTVLIVGVGLGLALALRKPFRSSGFFKALFFSPWITPTVAISLVWMWIYDADSGIANAVLGFFGIPALKWIGSSKTAMLSVIIVTVWKSAGYAAIFYLAALEKVPACLYEAASLDHAGKLRQFLKVTVPGISPTTFFLAVTSTISGLQAYDQIQVLTQGGPSGSTETLLYLYYRLGFQRFNMGRAAACAVVLLVIIIALAAIQAKLSKRMVTY
jgi:multiple sugar transport system permease protein